jgi:DNA polymerase delta subunit 1
MHADAIDDLAGREMIEATREYVLKRYNKANGYAYDSQVIYGDTDSVMVKFGVPTIEEAMKLGMRIRSAGLAR